MPTDQKQDERDEPEAPDLPRTIWLLSENRRALITLVISLGASVVMQRVLVHSYQPFRDLLEVDPLGATLLLPVSVWVVFALAHVTLTWLAYQGLQGEDFRVAVTADPSWLKYDKHRGNRLYRWFLGVGPSNWSTMLAVIALIAVVALVMRPALRELPLAFVIALAMVSTAWFSVAVTYAVHYARGNITRGGLEFPGDEPDRLLDYLYLAAGIQTTFGTTDVSVRTKEMRSHVLSQSLIAFVFNTVIVGMVISLLLSSG